MNSPSKAAAEPWTHKDAPGLGWARKALRSAVPRNTRFKMYFGVLDTPILSEVYVASRGRLRTRRIQHNTRLVIEAFPSSGNTYCRQAFLLSNPDISPDNVCSHTHSPRVVQRALRAGLPCIVVVRHPRDAVSSMVQRFTGLHIDSGFDYYTHYYSKLIPVKEHIVIAPFSTVISDFSSVVAQCNDKYGTDFHTMTEAGVSSDTVLGDIERRTAQRHGGQVLESKISRPSAARKPSADLLAHLTVRERTAMDTAVDTYRRFVAGLPDAAQPR